MVPIAAGHVIARGFSHKPGELDIQAFLSVQTQNPNYLHHGDVVETSVSTDDGAINPGTQRNNVVYP